MRLASLCIAALVLTTELIGCDGPAKPGPDDGPSVAINHVPGKAPNQVDRVGTTQPHSQPADALAKRVAQDPIAVLQEGLRRYNRQVKSYTATLYQQERVNPKGPMGPVQKILAKCLENPFSVSLDIVENPIGARQALYVEDDLKLDNKMLVLPAGLGRFLGWVPIDPHGPQARADGLVPIDQFGFKRNTAQLIRSYTLARKEAILTNRLLGVGAVDGRDVVICEVKIDEPKPTGRFEFPRVRVCIDREWLLPVAIDTWDAEGLERGHYRYENVNFKANLTAKDFAVPTQGPP